jgi:hypothetical protein
VIFNSYVSLPEGMTYVEVSNGSAEAGDVTKQRYFRCKLTP